MPRASGARTWRPHAQNAVPTPSCRQTPRSYRAAALSRRPGYPEWPHENPAPTRHRVEGILPRDRRAAAKVAAARAGENDLALRKTMAEQLIAAGVRLPARSSRPGAGVRPAGHMAGLGE